MKKVLFLFLLAILLMACNNDEDASNQKSILRFEFLVVDNNTLTENVWSSIDRELNLIELKLPAGVSPSELKPTIIISEGATIQPRNKLKMDFTNGIQYTVTAENGSVKRYMVNVIESN